jgi:hypothetical protein
VLTSGQPTGARLLAQRLGALPHRVAQFVQYNHHFRKSNKNNALVVGATGIEPVTPPV